MKNTYALLLFFCISFVFAQKNLNRTNTIAQAEMKGASGVVNFQANPNTANYDITYHKLEFTINPAVKFITGKVTTTYTALSNMNTITFDFANPLTVSSVKKGAANLTFMEDANNQLIITLPATESRKAQRNSLKVVSSSRARPETRLEYSGGRFMAATSARRAAMRSACA